MNWDLLLRRCRRLKSHLVAFGTSPEMSDEWSVFAGRTGPLKNSIDLVDTFLNEHRLADGRTLIEAFLETASDLSASDRALVAAWSDTVVGVFRIEHRRRDHLELYNYVDGLTYRARSNAGPAALDGFRGAGYAVGRIAPVLGDWMLSGNTRTYRPGTKAEDGFRALAASLAKRYPRYLFRNPERLRQAWASQAVERAAFIARFGGPELLGTGDEVHRRYTELLFEREMTARQASEERGGRTSPPIDKEDLPETLLAADDVGAIYDESWGLGLFIGYGMFRAAFEDPDRLDANPRHAEIIGEYVADESIDPSPFLQVARLWPENMTRVLSRALGRPDFDWARDGQRWLHEIKADHYRRGPLPLHIPLPDELIYQTDGQPLKAAGRSA